MTNQARNLQQLAKEAKAIVALAFRNGPIENLHAGKSCPVCTGQPGYRRITGPEMAVVMKNAVDHVFRLLYLKETNPAKYKSHMDLGSDYTVHWDEPSLLKTLEAGGTHSETNGLNRSEIVKPKQPFLD